MPTLTRKRVNHQPESWHIHFAGVRVGAIAERSGVPETSDRWQWSCGFYPGGYLREHRHGTAVSFDAARAAFDAAWREYLPQRTEAEFQECRDHQAWAAEQSRRSGQ